MILLISKGNLVWFISETLEKGIYTLKEDYTPTSMQIQEDKTREWTFFCSPIPHTE